MKAKLKKLWGWFKPALIKYLKKLTLKSVLKAIFGTAIGGGLKVKLVKWLVAELFEDIVEPLIKAAFIETEYTYHRIEGKILIKRLHKAIDENNESDYNSTIDNILS